jgi:hypothetical protein
VKLVQVPSEVFERYRQLATAADAFVHAHEGRPGFLRSYTDPKTGAPIWTLFGGLATALEALGKAQDDADRELDR